MRHRISRVRFWLVASGIAKGRKGAILESWMQPKDDSYPTRPSLLERLKNTSDQQSWQEFNDLYGRLIRGFALKAGLNEAEAEDVVQETMAGVAQHLPEFHYDPQRCSFKTWMLNLARWRVNNQFRKRLPLAARPRAGATSQNGTHTATIERVPEPANTELDRLWDQEWETALLQKALERVKGQVDARHWQIFDLYALKERTPREVAKVTGVTVGRVYLTKHRIGRLLRKQLQQMGPAII
jgi:RNA polymerase sigma factor (sigma-70 family)